MTKKKEQQKTSKPNRRVLRLVAQWVTIAIVLFIFVTGLYISIATYWDQSTQFTNFESLQTPVIVTIIILIIFGFASILYSSGASKDGSWTIMTGPYVR